MHFNCQLEFTYNYCRISSFFNQVPLNKVLSKYCYNMECKTKIQLLNERPHKSYSIIIDQHSLLEVHEIEKGRGFTKLERDDRHSIKPELLPIKVPVSVKRDRVFKLLLAKEEHKDVAVVPFLNALFGNLTTILDVRLISPKHLGDILDSRDDEPDAIWQETIIIVLGRCQMKLHNQKFNFLRKNTRFCVSLCKILNMAIISTYLQQLHALKIFNLNDVVSVTGNERTAKGLLSRYLKRALIIKIRRNLYSVTELSSGVASANHFEIASNISPTSYVAYHTAIEYHGIAHQQFFEVYVASESRFKNFEFENINYLYCHSKIFDGVETPPLNSKIKVCNLERTIVDCLDRIDRVGGLEELIRALAMVKIVREDLLLFYLKLYNNAFLYKKVGFVLDYFRQDYKLTDAFFLICQSNRNNSINYLTTPQESNLFNNEWRLYAPKNILSYLEQGSNEFI